MKSTLLVDTERDVQRGVSTGVLERDRVNGGGGAVEGWLHGHLTAVALAVIAAGLAVRVFAAASGYLNPDEALHYALINQPSAFLAYKASLTNAHPPLFFLVLYFCHLLGSSELMLRLPSVLSGTAFCWFVFRWIGTVFGRTAGVIGLIIAAFCPALIDLSAEVREYSLLLFSMAAALYFLARAFEGRSVRNMWLFSFFLYLAVLSHYSAALFALAAGVYCLARITDSQLPRKVVAAWIGGQAGALAIYGLLYVTHISRIKDSISFWSQPFYGAYFHPGHAQLSDFTRVRTLNIFQYLFEQPYISQAMLVFFLAGVVLLFARGLLPRRGQPRSCHLAILVFLPFMVVWGAALAGIYPYVGSRHTVFLAPFAIAVASFLIATVANNKLWAGLVVAVLLVAATNASGNPPEPYITKEDQRRTLMIAAMNEIERSVPRGERILVDLQTRFPMQYYSCGPSEIVVADTSRVGFESFACDAHRIISLDERTWKLMPGNFSAQFEKTARAYGLRPGDRVWIFQTGWGSNLDALLPPHFPKFRCLTAKRFGKNISLILFVVGTDLSPGAPLTGCGN